MKKCRAFFYAANASQQIAKTFRQSAPFAPLAWRNVVSICIQIGTITVDQYAISAKPRTGPSAGSKAKTPPTNQVTCSLLMAETGDQ